LKIETARRRAFRWAVDWRLFSVFVDEGELLADAQSVVDGIARMPEHELLELRVALLEARPWLLWNVVSPTAAQRGRAAELLLQEAFYVAEVLQRL
jgi:hypothetical protein